MTQEHIYFAKGMHCASCNILIEKKLLEIPGVKSINASFTNGKVVIECEGEKPTIAQLNTIFKEDNYTFFENAIEVKGGELPNATLIGFSISVALVAIFLVLEKLGVSGLLNVNSSSSALTFFGFGILAGLSSCAALVGGIVLSLSKQWLAIYAEDSSMYKKFQPHAMFNVGRILSYTILGGLLGLIGSRISLSLGITSFFVVIISFIMIVLGLQMLRVKGFSKLQFVMPRFITRYIANEQNFKGKHMPFVMGALTFFLPCGFTITAQTIALLSGSYIQGALIMGFFALGTAPVLLIIGLSSVTFSSRPHWSAVFSKTAGFLVLFFAIINIINQLRVFGYII